MSCQVCLNFYASFHRAVTGQALQRYLISRSKVRLSVCTSFYVIYDMCSNKIIYSLILQAIGKLPATYRLDVYKTK